MNMTIKKSLPAACLSGRQGKQGFTLIELMVSVAIFSVVMLVALGSLLAISAAERKAETLKTVMDNLSFAMETMSRTIRTGVDYHCSTSGTVSSPLSCPAGDTYLALVPVTGSARLYYRYDTDPTICSQTGKVGCISRSTDGITWLAITAPEILVSNMKFYVVGAERTSDTIQPKVMMTISGYVNIGSISSTTFALQTTMTQRVYDQ